MRTSLWWVLILIVLAAMASCIVEPLRYDWLACSKAGDCSSGYGCYVVSQLPNGVCLQDGNGLEPFQASDASPQEPAQEPTTEQSEVLAPEESLVDAEAPPEEPLVSEETAPEEPAQEVTSEEPAQEATPEEPTPEADGGSDP